jgi:glycerol kinase
LRLGTSDAFFNGRLTGVYATDVTTASRTSLMNLASLEWDDDLCALFGVPRECLPEIRATTGPFGEISGRPLTASLVDQQAALFGHGCEKPGDAKITFGTGAFALAVAGPKRPPPNDAGLVATVAWQQGSHPVEFALDGGVYNAASAVNWARGLGLFKEFGEINGFTGDPAIARGLAFVPALSGLACPHWDRSAAGLWIGLGLETSAADMMQSLLEGVAFRAAEVMAALDGQTRLSARISIDGGLARNPYFVTFLANVLNRTVVVAGTPDLTGLGTARMALRGAGLQTLPPLPQPLTEVAPLSPLSADHHLRFKRARERAGGWKDA